MPFWKDWLNVSCPLLRVNDFGSSPTIELSSAKNNSSKTVNENQNPLVLEQEVGYGIASFVI
jgi:hypothetical protein